MNNYVFISNEGTTYQPDGSFIENSQVVGYGYGDTVDDALNNMIAESSYLINNSFRELLAIEIKNDEFIPVSIK